MLKKIRAKQVVAKALQTRKKYLTTGTNVPICPFNLADSMGFDLRFVNIPSFEGMYLADEDIILISSDRPEGRKRFTCAHELGHHVLGHGTVIDEIIESGSDQEIEQEADLFASMILMPSSVVKRAAKDINIDFSFINNEDAYVLSNYLGVSFRALINQLKFNLRFIDSSSYDRLKKVSLPNVRSNILGRETVSEVFVIGSWWRERAIDISVGDFIVVNTAIEQNGTGLLKVKGSSENNVFQANEPGITQIIDQTGWGAFVRVSRKKYEGKYQFMHLEETEDDN